jgi:glycine betaine/choline ABC-type transport system substrate-binding protein
LTVVRKLNLGGTFICDRALRAGDIDVYAEYTGTALTAVFREPVTRDSADVLTRVRGRYAEAGLTVMPPLGFNNTFAILVRRRDAEQHALTSIGDLHRVAHTWRAGFGYEFLDREDGYRGLAAAYGLQFAQPPRVMDLTLMYRALANGEVDVVAGDATSALIDALDLLVLEDDRSYFPPYDAVPEVRSATLLAHPAVRAAIERIAGRISAADMRAMNHAVDVGQRDVGDVAGEFLVRLGP